MKEFLVNHDNKWTLQLLDSDTEENSYRVAVPSGADWAYKNTRGKIITMSGEIGDSFICDLVWQRHTQPKELPFIDDEPIARIKRMKAQPESISVPISELEKLGVSLPIVDDKPQDEAQQLLDKYPHYYKDVRNLSVIDVYDVLDLFGVTDQAVGHTLKKLLVTGKRGAGKNYLQDLIEARDTLNRAIAICERK